MWNWRKGAALWRPQALIPLNLAGGTPVHADLGAAVTHLLVRALGADCRVSASDLKVRIEATDLTTFPDVTVVCGPRELSRLDAHAVTNMQ